jgi:hypothetical protein
LTSSEVLDLKSHFVPDTYTSVYRTWITADRENLTSSYFEIHEPFIQGFDDMSDHQKDVQMYQYWVGLDKQEQTEALQRIVDDSTWVDASINEYISYGDKLSVCITTSGASGIGYDFGFVVLDPSKAIGTSTNGLAGYQELINHEFTHSVAAIITRQKVGAWTYWFTEGLPEYLSGHQADSNAGSLNVVRDRIQKPQRVDFSEYSAFNFAVKKLADDLGNESDSFGRLLMAIRNYDQSFGALTSENVINYKDPNLGISYAFLSAFESTFTDVSGTPISYSDYIQIYDGLLIQN